MIAAQKHSAHPSVLSIRPTYPKRYNGYVKKVRTQIPKTFFILRVIEANAATGYITKKVYQPSYISHVDRRY